jgi:molybdopterin synthase catalytic subunit
MSGPSPPQPLVRLTRQPIEVASLLGPSPEDGAVCLFLGVVRKQNQGRAVLHLEYEAYEEMALAEMQRLAEQAAGRFAVSQVRLVHRLGRMEVGEASVAIVVSSPHRAAGFEACRFLIDEVKRSVPIWKKELYADGAVWLEGSENAGSGP